MNVILFSKYAQIIYIISYALYVSKWLYIITFILLLHFSIIFIFKTIYKCVLDHGIYREPEVERAYIEDAN